MATSENRSHKRRPVTEMMGEALPRSLELGLSSFAVSMLASLLLGVLAARKRDGLLDNGVKFLAILGQAMPGFWVGIVAIFIFSVYWPLFPAGGTGSLATLFCLSSPFPSICCPA